MCESDKETELQKILMSLSEDIRAAIEVNNINLAKQKVKELLKVKPDDIATKELLNRLECPKFNYNFELS